MMQTKCKLSKCAVIESMTQYTLYKIPWTYWVKRTVGRSLGMLHEKRLLRKKEQKCQARKQWNGENQGILSISRPGSWRERMRGKRATGANLEKKVEVQGELQKQPRQPSWILWAKASAERHLVFQRVNATRSDRFLSTSALCTRAQIHKLVR